MARLEVIGNLRSKLAPCQNACHRYKGSCLNLFPGICVLLQRLTVLVLLQQFLQHLHWLGNNNNRVILSRKCHIIPCLVRRLESPTAACRELQLNGTAAPVMPPHHVGIVEPPHPPSVFQTHVYPLPTSCATLSQAPDHCIVSPELPLQHQDSFNAVCEMLAMEEQAPPGSMLNVLINSRLDDNDRLGSGASEDTSLRAPIFHPLASTPDPSDTGALTDINPDSVDAVLRSPHHYGRCHKLAKCS